MDRDRTRERDEDVPEDADEAKPAIEQDEGLGEEDSALLEGS
jgi:hypothetical protein